MFEPGIGEQHQHQTITNTVTDTNSNNNINIGDGTDFGEVDLGDDERNWGGRICLGGSLIMCFRV